MLPFAFYFWSDRDSEKHADTLGEHALVVGLVGLQHSFLFFIREFHSLEHHSDQVDLHARVSRHEVRHQNVLDIL